MNNRSKPFRFKVQSKLSLKLILACTLISVLARCKEAPTTSDQWIRNRNREVLRAASLLIEETGNKEADVKVLQNMRDFKGKIDTLIAYVSENDKKRTLKAVNIHLDSLKRMYYFPSPSFEQYLTLDEHSTTNEFKIQLALLESETFNLLTSKVGANDFKFDKLELYFIPDKYHDYKSQQIKGKVLFALTSTMIDKHAKMFVNEKEIELKDGFGIIDLTRSELSETNSIEVTFKSDIPNTTITRELQIIPRRYE
ncbi:hypothetical protein [Marinoscillum sp.]|uniref:hypothetical protein n=1 Tax=Marinoscillum sp. TaxID=2024838 RepID=UPI003BAA9B21